MPRVLNILILILITSCVPIHPSFETPPSCANLTLDTIELNPIAWLEADATHIKYWTFGASHSEERIFYPQNGSVYLQWRSKPFISCDGAKCRCLTPQVKTQCQHIFEVHPHPLASLQEKVDSWLDSHPNYNPEWKPDVVQASNCLDASVEQLTNQ